ncbi:MAG: hypothetical protein LBC75_13970 [Fibromonadaceae bacterium]|jgi:hypothetical protein|nr:hypothetical protein [Fibromonadaceae bacterium]
MEKKDLTAADVWAMFAETDRKMQENARQMAENERILNEKFAETDRKIAEGHRLLDEKFKELGIERLENDRKLNEKFEALGIERLENDRKLNEKFKELGIERLENERKLTEKFEALGIKVNDLKSNVVGIGNSNGEFAEEYFHNSLENKMEFAGVHFDFISSTFKLTRKAPDGRRIKDQFDIVMLNGEAAAIIEIKHKARKDDPKQIVSQKVSNFRFLFPEYTKLKIYLGLAAFSFEESAEKEAKELGIGLLRQIGETVEYETKWVRAY